MTTLDPFETALLARLRDEVATPSRGRTPRRAGAALGAAAAASLTAVVLWPQPAWAVDGRADGDVLVTIRSFEDVDGLRKALAAEGVEAVIEAVDEAEYARALATVETPTSPACDAISDFAANIGGGEATYLIPSNGVATDAVLHIVHGGDIGDAKGSTGDETHSWILVWWEGGPC